jgi:hypothetical protein
MEKQKMRDEPYQSFPLPNEHELDYIYIKTELENEGIEVQRISIDDTINTNKKVPEEIKSHIREYAADKGITVAFKVSSRENSDGRVR